MAYLAGVIVRIADMAACEIDRRFQTVRTHGIQRDRHQAAGRLPGHHQALGIHIRLGLHVANHSLGLLQGRLDDATVVGMLAGLQAFRVAELGLVSIAQAGRHDDHKAFAHKEARPDQLQSQLRGRRPAIIEYQQSKGAVAVGTVNGNGDLCLIFFAERIAHGDRNGQDGLAHIGVEPLCRLLGAHLKHGTGGE